MFCRIVVCVALFLCVPVYAHAQDLIVEHSPYGIPECAENSFKIRTAYLLCFDEAHRIPKWTMYHVVKDYRNTPKREGKFSSFRSDPDLENEAKDSDYRGLLASRGYARGHFTPYGVLGGDRDQDGVYAEHEGISDPDDERTVFEGNYMSNIAPQHHAGFNGSPGLWWHLERWIQDDMVCDRDEEAHVIAGAILGPGPMEVVGENHDIIVPPMFYKIVTFKAKGDQPERTLAFMFPHQEIKHGRIQDFLTSIDVIESMTNLNFFKDHTINEDIDTWHTWQDWFASIESDHTK